MKIEILKNDTNWFYIRLDGCYLTGDYDYFIIKEIAEKILTDITPYLPLIEEKGLCILDGKVKYKPTSDPEILLTLEKKLTK